MSGDALLVIDTQRGAFDASLVGEWAMPDGDALIAACQRALAWARANPRRASYGIPASGSPM